MEEVSKIEAKQDLEKIGYGVIFKQKEYVKYMIASIINRFGDSIDLIAYTMLVYIITKDPSWSAIMFALNMLPTVIISPFASGIVEKKNHKKIIVFTDAIRGIGVGFIAISYMCGILKPWMLVCTTLINSSVEAFGAPAYTAFLPRILKKKYFEFGMSLKSGIGQVMELVGRALAGVIIYKFGVGVAIGIDMITFFIAAIIIMTIKADYKKSEKVKIDVTGYINLLKEGFAYIRKKKTICVLMIVSPVIAIIYTPLNTMMAPMVEQVLGAGAELMGFISGALSVGMILASLAYPYIRKKLKGVDMFVIAFLGMILLYAGYVACGMFIKNQIGMYVVILGVSFIAGFGSALVMSFTSIEFMKIIDKEYLARGAAVYNAITAVSVPIVSLLVSGIVKIISIKELFIGTAVLCLIFILIFKISKLKFE